MSEALPSQSTLLLAFTIPGQPVPRERARKGKTSPKTGKAVWYTPERSRRYAELVVLSATHRPLPQGEWDLSPIKHEKRPGWERVKSASRVAIHLWLYFGSARKADIDNVQKAIADALVRGGVLRDDSHTVVGEWRAVANIDRRNPRAEVEIHEMPAAVVPPPRARRRAA